MPPLRGSLPRRAEKLVCRRSWVACIAVGIEAVVAETGAFATINFGFDGLHFFVEPGAYVRSAARRIGP